MSESKSSVFDVFLLRVAAARVTILFTFHILVFAACFAFAYLVRFEFAMPAEFNETFKWSLPVVVGVQLLVGIVFGFYRGWWRYVGMDDVIRLVIGVTTALGLLVALWYLTPVFKIDERFTRSPRGVLLVDWAFALLTLFGTRLLIRVGRDRF